MEKKVLNDLPLLDNINFPKMDVTDMNRGALPGLEETAQHESLNPLRMCHLHHPC